MYTSIVVDMNKSVGGDLSLVNGDIELSLHEDAIYQMIQNIISTPPNDADVMPLTTFDPNDFLGTIIDSDLLRNLRNTILDTISDNSSLYRSELDVQAFKITEESVAITIKLLTIENDHAVRAIFDTTSGSVASFIYTPSYNTNTDDIIVRVPLPETKLTYNGAT